MVCLHFELIFVKCHLLTEYLTLLWFTLRVKSMYQPVNKCFNLFKDSLKDVKFRQSLDSVGTICYEPNQYVQDTVTYF